VRPSAVILQPGRGLWLLMGRAFRDVALVRGSRLPPRKPPVARPQLMVSSSQRTVRSGLSASLSISVSTLSRPGGSRTRIHRLGRGCPLRWTTDRWRHGRESNPLAGQLCRPPPAASENRAKAPPGRFERPTSRLRKTVFYPLNYEGSPSRNRRNVAAAAGLNFIPG
jgi:hypothetical protein